MPRLAPFSAPRDRLAPSPAVVTRPAPFVPSWVRTLVESAAAHPSAVSPIDEAAPLVSIDSVLATDAPGPDFGSQLDASALSSLLAMPSDASQTVRQLTPAVAAPAIAAGTDALEEAAAEIESLARALGSGVRRPTPAQLRAIDDAARFGIDPALTEPAGPMLLPAWSDEDFVDIMPTRMPAVSAAVSSDAEAAAARIVAVAERVRRGELRVPVYAIGMGDAATLAATLAALLAMSAE